MESLTRNLLLNAVKCSPMEDNDVSVSFENRESSFTLKCLIREDASNSKSFTDLKR